MACSRRDAGGPAKDAVTLTVWDWHAADPSKGVGLWLTEIDRAFERAHPGIRVKHVAQPHTEYYEVFKAAAAARRGPDVVMLHQGPRVLDVSASLRPLGEFVTPELKAKLAGWDLTSGPDGTPWAVPIAVQGLVWYANKAVLKEAGLDPDRMPATWDEFLTACDAAKAAGKAGIAAGQKEGFWGEWFYGSASLQSVGTEGARRLVTGEMKWTDPTVAAVLERLKELSDRECFQRGAMSTPLFPDASEVFMRGEAAFFLGLVSDVAHWKDFGEILGPENVGVMTCPVFAAGPEAGSFPVGGAFAYGVTAWAERPAEAFDYISFIASDENARTFLTDVGSFPANQRYDRAAIADPAARAISEWLEKGRGVSRVDPPVPVGDALRRECQRLMTGQTDVAGALAAIERVAEGERPARPEGDER